MRKFITTICLGWGLALWLAAFSLAAAVGSDPLKEHSGLSMNYVKMVVSNLPIGNTVSLTKVCNAPLVIGNNYDVAVPVTITLVQPPKEFEGYEVLPNFNWVVVESQSLTLAAHSKTNVDVKVHLPNDEKLFGKKYRVGVQVMTLGDQSVHNGINFGFSVTGSFLFSVAPGRNEGGLESALKNPADADWDIAFPRQDIWSVKPGTVLEVVNDQKQRPLLKNNSKDSLKFLLASVDPKESTYNPDAGVQYSGHPDDLTFPDDEISLGSGKSQELKFKVKVPATVDLSKGPLVYLVSVRSGKARNVERFVIVYLWGGAKLLRTGK
jgi:hypothetical protein